jgi:DNA-binding NarL/FixJ family response regulator
MEKLLSKRELQIVQYVKRGFSNQEIASKLALSYHTVKVHLNRIYSKMGLYQPGRNKRVSMVIKTESVGK